MTIVDRMLLRPTMCYVESLSRMIQSDEVNFIYTKMKEMSDEKYPINRFIEFAQEWTAAIDNFKKSVEGLDISDKEKKMLDSIVSNKRSGEMQIHVDGKAIISIEIPECKSSWELARELDVVLFSRLSRVKDREISIWFEESA